MKNKLKNKVKKSMKKSPLLTILIICIAVIYVLFFSPMSDRAEKIQLDGTMQVHMIDVGQGDSFLVVSPEGDIMLIDAGTNDSEAALRRYLDSLGIETIKYAVFTHPHEDHIGGADMVLNTYNVENVILPDATHTSSTFERMLEAIDSHDINTIIATPGNVYELGTASFKILGPNGSSYESLNDYSIVLRLDYGGTSFMMTGDAEVLAEREMLENFPFDEFRCDVLKMGHHGSSTSSCDEFLDAVSPSIVLIPCGENNDYGHPHREIVRAITDRGLTAYRTDKDGSVVLKADGNTVTLAE